MPFLFDKSDIHSKFRKELNLADKYDIIRTTIKYFYELKYDEQLPRIKEAVAEYSKKYIIIDLVIDGQVYNDPSVNYNYSLIVLDKDTN